MRPPPPTTDWRKYPVTTGVSVLAMAVTIAWHAGGSIEPLVMSPLVAQGQVWRLLTSTLPHVDIFHLLFNLYWLWVFGSAVEGVFGSLRTAAVFVFFAVGSSAAEFALFRGGVGLSGVGYGLFGMLWVLSIRDSRFHAVVDAMTVLLFIAWFFLCIVLTVTNIWIVGNVAHGMGALQGVLLGFAITARSARPYVIAGLTGLLLFVVVAATGLRPFVNLSATELAREAYLDLQAGGAEKAAALLEKALQLDDSQAAHWFNLGIAYDRLGREGPMLDAYRRAVKADPRSETFKKSLVDMLSHLSHKKLIAGENENAAALLREALALDDRNGINWHNLGIADERLGHRDAALQAYERAFALVPNDPRIEQSLNSLRGRPKE